ncbi:response regulator transcription factor [Hazenella coriacea]|uniref:response regulator transcription factor n=1 Tax=Hazenella coriacea TaxID=1179467 RepID=UPI001048375C|nr:response regulator transcription factor [Hazenella coriacea]
MKHHILVVDDDEDILQLLQDALTFEQFQVTTANRGEKALQVLAREQIDLVVLDIMMPGLDGIETTRRIRQKFRMPIILLSAKDREIDKVIGLEVGADDYMTKPFGIQELVARIKVQFRQLERLNHPHLYSQKQSEWTEPSSRPPLVLDEQKYEAYIHGVPLELSTREFQILNYLYQNAHLVLSREQIYHNVWGDEYGDLNTVTVHIKNIRRKIGKQHQLIKTIWGVGYKLVLDGEDG